MIDTTFITPLTGMKPVSTIDSGAKNIILDFPLL